MTTQAVLNLKEALEKELPEPTDVERCKDILERLKECVMTLDILTETLIGATVNKLKSHKELGDTAKALIKSWKQVAASSEKKSAKDDFKNGEGTKGKSIDGVLKSCKAAPAERRGSLESQDSGGDDNYDAQSEWTGLPEQRRAVCAKLFPILLAAKPALLKEGVGEAAVMRLVGPRTAEIEAAIQTQFKSDRKAYADKARSLFFNLKKNQPLAVSILLGHVDPPELVLYTAEQLASDEVRTKRQETAQRLIDSRRLDWDQANEARINEQCGIKGDLLNASLFTCGRCKSIKTTSTQKQTRSADEPMTVFVLCLNCGKRWKC
jgi:transcription elongation factor S-II